jgi:amidophosphoribosyltransferase
MKKHIKILKKKLKNFDPKLKEECGVFGVSNAKDASALTALGPSRTSTPWSRRMWNCDF